MTDYTVVNPYIGHGIVLLSADDADDAAGQAANALSEALSDGVQVAPANFGFTNGEPDGDSLGVKNGVSFTLFSTATEAEVAAVKAFLGKN